MPLKEMKRDQASGICRKICPIICCFFDAVSALTAPCFAAFDIAIDTVVQQLSEGMDGAGGRGV